MRVITELYFIKGTFAGRDFVELIKSCIDFKIGKFCIDEISERELKYDDKYLIKIKRCSSECSLEFINAEKDISKKEEFWIQEATHPSRPQNIIWTLIDREPNIELIQRLSSHPNFMVGYAYDSDFSIWQNERSISNYEYYDKDHSKLPKVFDKLYGYNVIDISNNPGRSKMVKGMLLQASWKMYFGANFYNFVTKEKITSFPDAYQIVELNSNVVMVQLTEKVSDTDSLLIKLKSFRDWIKMDSLEKLLSEQ